MHLLESLHARGMDVQQSQEAWKSIAAAAFMLVCEPLSLDGLSSLACSFFPRCCEPVGDWHVLNAEVMQNCGGGRVLAISPHPESTLLSLKIMFFGKNVPTRNELGRSLSGLS